MENGIRKLVDFIRYCSKYAMREVRKMRGEVIPSDRQMIGNIRIVSHEIFDRWITWVSWVKAEQQLSATCLCFQAARSLSIFHALFVPRSYKLPGM